MKPDPRVDAGVFYSAGLDPARFVRSDAKSSRGPCWCGGERRLVVWLGKWNYQCDICGKKGFLVNSHPTSDTLAELKAKAEAQAVEREHAVRARLAEFTTAELWMECHRRLGEQQHAWWAEQGLAADWQEFYQLGYVPDRIFASAEGPFHRPAYTIPIFETGFNAVNCQYRIVDPPPGAGKYRQEPGLPAAAFLSRPDLPLADSMIVVEGAKKAGVLCSHLPRQPQIVGLPGARSWAGMDERLAECGRVWVMLDPDATEAARALAENIGKAARVVELPAKPDDMLLRYGATAETFRRACRYAQPAH